MPEGACCAISPRSLKDVMAGFWAAVTTLDAIYCGLLERVLRSAKTLCDYKTSMV